MLRRFILKIVRSAVLVACTAGIALSIQSECLAQGCLENFSIYGRVVEVSGDGNAAILSTDPNNRVFVHYSPANGTIPCPLQRQDFNRTESLSPNGQFYVQAYQVVGNWHIWSLGDSSLVPLQKIDDTTIDQPIRITNGGNVVGAYGRYSSSGQLVENWYSSGLQVVAASNDIQTLVAVEGIPNLGGLKVWRRTGGGGDFELIEGVPDSFRIWSVVDMSPNGTYICGEAAVYENDTIFVDKRAFRWSAPDNFVLLSGSNSRADYVTDIGWVYGIVEDYYEPARYAAVVWKGTLFDLLPEILPNCIGPDVGDTDPFFGGDWQLLDDGESIATSDGIVRPGGGCQATIHSSFSLSGMVLTSGQTFQYSLIIGGATSVLQVSYSDDGGATYAPFGQVQVYCGEAEFLSNLPEVSTQVDSAYFKFTGTDVELVDGPFTILIAPPDPCDSIINNAWTNAAGGAFEDAPNWSSGAPPATNHVAQLSTAGDYTVTLSASRTIAALENAEGEHRLELGNSTLTLQYDTYCQPALMVSSGTLVFDSGAVVISGTSMVDDTNSVAGLKITNSASVQFNDRFDVAENGSGELVIDSGGVVFGTAQTESNLYVAEVEPGTRGSVTLNGSGSSLHTLGTLAIGGAGNGVLTVSDGAGVFDVQSLQVYGGDSAEVRVDGSGSSVEAGTISLYANSQALLAATNGGAIACDLLVLGVNALVEGPVLAITTVTPPGTQSRSASRISEPGIYSDSVFLFEGATVATDDFALGIGGFLGLQGPYFGDLVNGGTLSPGGVTESAGGSNVIGNYTQTGTGALEIELGGLTPGIEHDALFVDGAVELDGEIQVKRLFGYTPQLGDVFEILTGLAISGEFDTIIVANNEVEYEATYEENRVLLTVIALNPTSIDDESNNLPNAFSLAQNYPNPFNPTTTISFSLPRASDVKIEIFNIVGQRIASLIGGTMQAGEHHVEWDGQTDSGQSAATGVYFYRLQAGNLIDTKKMLLLK
ncbi:MAG: FlgD immunoglobulin-like domain containing protein [Candidatus Zixiibacteriota bacterium]